MSRNDMVLFAWGSRSTSSVRLPRSASAAARLMAVVVFPTPPFWLQMATIIGAGTRRTREYYTERRREGDLTRRGGCLHLIFPEIVGIQALEPLLQPVGVRLLRREIHRLRVVDHRLLDEDRCPRPQRQCNRVARARVDRHRVVRQRQVDERVEGVVLQVA